MFIPFSNKTVAVNNSKVVGRGILLRSVHKKPVHRGEIVGGSILNANGIVSGITNYDKIGRPTARKAVPHIPNKPDIRGGSLLNEVKVPIQKVHKRKVHNNLVMDA